jgi:valyl-tRNA synthetase
MLARLDQVIIEATEAFGDFDYARALERTEAFFWWFCDDYVELVKGRAYSETAAGRDSARRALGIAVDSLHRLLAPLLPFATEEAWRWDHDTSVHIAPWPTPTSAGGDASLIEPVLETLGQVRRAKTEAKVSQRAEVASLAVTVPNGVEHAIDAGLDDLREAGSIRDVTVVPAEVNHIACTVELVPTESN